MGERRGGRGEVDHDTTPRFQQRRQRLAGHQERAGEVDRERTVPVLQAGLMRVRTRLHGSHVDQNLKPTQLGHRSRHRGDDVLLARYVEDGRGESLGGAGSLGGCGRRSQAVGGDVVADHRCAFIEQAGDRGRADPGTGAGDDDTTI